MDGDGQFTSSCPWKMTTVFNCGSKGSLSDAGAAPTRNIIERRVLGMKSETNRTAARRDDALLYDFYLFLCSPSSSLHSSSTS